MVVSLNAVTCRYWSIDIKYEIDYGVALGYIKKKACVVVSQKSESIYFMEFEMNKWLSSRLGN